MNHIVRCLFINLVFAGFFYACQSDRTSGVKPDELLKINDPHSYADDNEARVKHIFLDLSINFDAKQLAGSVTLYFDKNGADSLFLDSKGLVIKAMSSGGKTVNWKSELPDPILGTKISIPVSHIDDSIVINYHTTDYADALQWLEKGQTFDKKGPFLFSQGQAILTRTWIPIQDSPGIRFTYKARIQAPEGMLALMSATNPQSVNTSGVYHFAMEEPVPAYLVAIACGFLEFRPLDDRSGVFAEPGMIEKATWEFSETPEMIDVAEKLYGPYIWHRYDILVLPPAFPFGGMENPMLTFATPTIIAGDKSLANLIAHELAHSWSGNLVTNATWNDFWLNEGFTVYFERRIVEEVKSKDYADMTAIIGRNDLEEEMIAIGPDKMGTQLKLQLDGLDPDEGMTDIAYEKGSLFIALLEKTFGRDSLDNFLNGYFKDFKYKPITTEIFEEYLYSKLNPALLDEISTKKWLYSPGLPDNAPVFKSKMFERVALIQDSLLSGQKIVSYENLDFNQWLYFLRRIKDSVTVAQLDHLDKLYKFSNSGNSEIRALWLEINILKKNTKVNTSAAEFLNRVGRRKFQTPLYEAFIKSGQTETGKQIYLQSRSNYHFVSRNTLDDLFEIKNSI